MPDQEVMDAFELARKAAPSIKEARGTSRPGILPWKQLPLWPQEYKSAPSALLRSALFRVYGKRGACRDSKIASWHGQEITYSGVELGQHHLDVWMHLVDMCSRSGSYDQTGFTVRGLLKSMGRADGRSQYDWLRGVMLDLHTAAVTLRTTNESGNVENQAGVHLVEYYCLTPGQCSIQLNPMVGQWFANDQYARLHWDTRKKLRGDLTQWLHGYICTHLATRMRPSSIRLARLQELCGSGIKEPRRFAWAVKQSMRQLEKYGEVMSWSIDDDVLSFARPPKRKALT